MLRRSSSFSVLLQQGAAARRFSHSKPVTKEKARAFFAKPEPVAKVFALNKRPAVQSASELCKARVEFAKQQNEANAPPATLTSLARQECALLSAEELTQTLWALTKFDNCEEQRLEVLREMFGRNFAEFTGDELVQVLELIQDWAPDRPVQNVRAGFAEELAKRSSKSFSTKSLVFLLPAASVPSGKFAKLAKELAKRTDLTPQELLTVHQANEGKDDALALHITNLLSANAESDIDLKALQFDSLVNFRFTEPSVFSQQVWEAIEPSLETTSHTLKQVESLVRLLPFGSKAMQHDKVAKLVDERFLNKSHDHVALVLHSLAAIEYNKECAVWIRVREAMEKSLALYLSPAKQLQALRSVNKHAPKQVLDVFLTKSLFSNAGTDDDKPWGKPVDYTELGTEDLMEIQHAFKNTAAPVSPKLVEKLDQEIKSRLRV